MLYSFKTIGNKALVGGGVVEKGIPPTATNYWGLSSNNKNLRAQANMNPLPTTTNIVKTKNMLVVSTINSTNNVSWSSMTLADQDELIDVTKNVLSSEFKVPKDQISVTGKDGSVILIAELLGIDSTVAPTPEDISSFLDSEISFNGVLGTLFGEVDTSTEEYEFPKTYTFTQRGWTYNTPYDPSAGTLFYAVDLYSNDASRISATALYGNPNTWQFDYTGDLKDFSQLFNCFADASRNTDVSGFTFDIGSWDVSGVNNMQEMFNNATNFNQDISGWNVSNVTAMDFMFTAATNFDQDINGWNVDNVNNMRGMFLGATNFDQSLNDWNVNGVTDMEWMFYNATSFNQDISGWNVSNVTNMNSMFRNATSFNQSLNDWNVSEVTNMNGMFYNAINFNQDIGNWDVSGVTAMNNMFQDATNFNQDIGNWVVSGVTDMNSMFRNATSFNQDISGWDVSEVTNMSLMFRGTSLNQDIWVWDVCGNAILNDIFTNSSMIDVRNDLGYKPDDDASGTPVGLWFNQGLTISYTFTQRGITSPYDPSAGTLFNAVDLYSNDASRNDAKDLYGYIDKWGFDYTDPTDSVKNFSDLFHYEANVNRPTDVSGFNFDIGNWDVSGVTNMDSMFKDASFNQDIGSWNVSNVTQMNDMFKNSKFNQDVDSWNVSKVTTMDNMFAGSTFNQNISSWDTGKVKFMNSMFKDTSFNQDIGNWDVSAVENMTQMFRNTPFNKDIGSWNVSNVTNMQQMFYGTYNFNQDISGWNVSNVTTMEDTFRNATDMSQNIWAWDVCGNATFISIFVNSAMASVLNAYDVSGGNNATQIGLDISTQGSWFTGPFTPYTFTERGWSDTDPTYDPSAGTLFYAVDLYSNDASRNEAIFAYGIINKWQFDYTGDLKDFSYLFNSSADAARPSDVSGFNFDIGNWDVSGVTNMDSMFKGAFAFNQNISGWDVANVNNMKYMFTLATDFNQDIGGWNVSNVTDMRLMFWGATSFNQPIGEWDTGAVENMTWMFYQCSSFNQQLNDWNVSNVTTMSQMFNNSTSFNQDIGSWNVSNVTDMVTMFNGANSFNQDISGWNVSNVTNFNSMFNGATDMSQNIWVWDVCGNATFTNIFQNSAMLDISNNNGYLPDEDASANGAGPGTWFTAGLYTFTERGWTSGTYDPSAGTLFYAVDLYSNDASNSQAISLYGDINTWQFDYTGDLKDFTSLFRYSISGRPTDVSGFNFDIGNWNVSGVTNMDSMFYKNSAFNQDIGSWNVSGVTNIARMFYQNSNFNQDIGSWDVGNVTTMQRMFYEATSFNQDISGWDVSNVISMYQMFYLAENMSQNISVWDVCGNALFANIFHSSPMASVLNANDVSGGSEATQAALGDNTAGSWFLTPYTFTSRGWNNTDPTYNPSAGTLFYAVDLYSNDASRNEAILAYNNINTWQFDYTGDLKNLSDLFYWSPDIFPSVVRTGVKWFNFNIGNWDVSGVTDMNRMFQEAVYFNQDIGGWDVGNVTTMQQMFHDADVFNQDISTWNVSGVTDMKKMFQAARDFNQDISGWDVNNVDDFSRMFFFASDMSQNIWSWDVCGNADFEKIFAFGSGMLAVPNNNGYLPDNDASANGAGPGTWFTGP